MIGYSQYDFLFSHYCCSFFFSSIPTVQYLHSTRYIAYTTVYHICLVFSFLLCLAFHCFIDTHLFFLFIFIFVITDLHSVFNFFYSLHSFRCLVFLSSIDSNSIFLLNFFLRCCCCCLSLYLCCIYVMIYSMYRAIISQWPIGRHSCSHCTSGVCCDWS